MHRELFEQEHTLFRETAREFFRRDVVPSHEQWSREGVMPRAIWRRAGELGLLGFNLPAEYGGGGARDFRFNAVLQEERELSGARGLSLAVHTDLVSGYLLAYADEDQRRRWFPGFCTGELITGLAMSEPGTGSDLKSITTTAERDGDTYVINGAKTFITNGLSADLFLVACKTDPSAGSRGLSLIAVEATAPGFHRGRKLEKIGLKGQDTAELFFEDARVPVANRLGEENQAFGYMIGNLPQERLCISVMAVAAIRAMLDLTLDYVKTRRAFGQTIGSFQNSRFTLAELESEYRIAQVYVDRAIVEHNAGQLTADDAAVGKWWITELQKKTADVCLQLHGGAGYLADMPIAQAFLDARVQTIYGGTTEIMKEIVGRSLGL
jgi:alkylation response protein AidB-like acyl-CoA dehydrogenase